jgi:transcriptional regulator NrdR family protein
MSTSCPICKFGSKVTESRRNNTAVRRRRECVKCGERWTTYEVPSAFMAFAVEAATAVGKLGDLQYAAEQVRSMAEDYDINLGKSLDNLKPSRS